MIVVAVVGVLAATAIPAFQRMQMRSKCSEVRTNIVAIRTAQVGYGSEFGEYAPAQTSPESYGGSQAIAFTDTGPPGQNFATIGWAPEGSIFFQYAVGTTETGSAFSIAAAADLDQNGTPQIWGYVRPDTTGATAPPLLGCTGVWDETTQTADRLSAVGPCGATYGRSEF